MKFVFEKHNSDYGQYSPEHGIVINLSAHKDIITSVIDTIIHESLHQAIASVGYSQYDVIWNTCVDGEEDVVQFLTDRSIQ